MGAMQGAEVRKDLLEADARDRKSQCRSSSEKTIADMAIFHCQMALRGVAQCAPAAGIEPHRSVDLGTMHGMLGFLRLPPHRVGRSRSPRSSHARQIRGGPR